MTTATSTIQVLIVDDNPADSLALQRKLKNSEVAAFSFSTVSTISDAKTMLDKAEFDLCMLDHLLPDGDSLEVLEFMRANEMSTPVIVVTGNLSPELGVQAMRHGASDIIDKALIASNTFDQVLINNIIRAERMSNLTRVSSIDHLTGLYSRHYMEMQLERSLRLCRRTDLDMALMVIALDDFDRFHVTIDSQSREAGLQSVARCIESHTRDTDIAARWCADAFIVFANNSTEKAVALAGSKIVTEVAGIQLPGGRSSLTASVGVVGFHDQIATDSDWIDLATAAMQRAKAAGGNRVVSGASATQPD